jgi:hypothetical protein
MTQALPAGPTKRRALFGLLDADGWGWASAKAAVWFIIIIFVLGYLPDRAYYFTVNRTLELGILAWSPVNFCPPENETLRCPAPVGAIVPWHPSGTPALPAARADGAVIQVTTSLLYIGGSDGATAQSSVSVAPFDDGVIGAWTAGPELPEARTDASVAFFGGSIYVVGGFAADGAPTATTFVLTPDAATGDLGEWTVSETLALPEARADSAIVALGDGLLLIGGQNADGATRTTWKAPFDAESADLGAWTVEPGVLNDPSTGGLAAQVGDYVWLYGGSNGSNPTRTVERGELESTADGQVLARWGVHGPDNPTNLPEGRVDATGFVSTGALYLVGGSDGSSARSEVWWAVPSGDGTIDEWKHLAETDLPAPGLAGAAALTSGAEVYLIGGRTGDGVIGHAVQANLAPQAPFFQLGLVGATVPALKVSGEIGQQLGYLNASAVGGGAFAALIVIGWAMAHRERTREALEKLRRRR